ncbi:MAG TPA: type II toxin-antitoxin system VapC family toxin [Thermoanaerobaculia bacterium]|jgi:predicted nucleic acid-binding protein|nr:type II toxin-antitoxin system VapC family toxin [Thermoanaerobaculia bacterium]
MTAYVIDASVAMKWFVPEIHSAAAAQLLDPDLILCAPDLIIPEFGNTLWKKTRRGEVSRAEAQEILNAFENLPLEIYQSTTLLAPAFSLSLSLDRTVYGSLYLALAVAQDCALITADQKFHAAAAASPFAKHIRWIGHEPISVN